ncbi:NACHT domain-containing protein [Sessilibacter corallicola]|uniref:ATP-binding protein n=1 Tax=Sessilibacter corallicola TaxID=2904075 RepID=A0ABQ0A9L8_9GAMM
MFKGGIADKLGNGYESKWIVKYLLLLVADKLDWFKFEGLDPEYDGFEFACEVDGRTEWHQTKNNCSTGNWSINALQSKGVLKAFANRLGNDSNAHCFFVSQDNAKDFRTLSEKSRTTDDLSQLEANLAKNHKDALTELKKHWGVDGATLFDWLNRSIVEILPERELDTFIENYGDLYFKNGKGTYSFLRGILEENFNAKLTTDELRDQILKKGTLVFRSWLFDSTLKNKIEEETKDYLDSYLPFGFSGKVIERQAENDVVDVILNQQSDKNIVFITGSAGVGKSGINRGVLKKLVDKGIPVLAFRIDQFLSCNNKEALGFQITGRQESPVTTLKILSPDDESVLFIDQVDSVSDISGRDGNVKRVLFRLLEEAKSFGTVKVVISCRTFDLNNDARLKDIYDQDSVSNIEVPQLDWETEIQPLLEEKAVEIQQLTDKQKQLLSLPINLTIFLNVYESGISFNSTTALYDKFITKKQRHISSTTQPSWTLVQVLGELSQWMSEKQQLSAPVYVLDQYPNALETLSSEGLITSSKNNISFFHESFFDYIYARRFVTNNTSISEMLCSGEQHLFRRTQVRQILEALREIDSLRYLKELSQLLINDEIRYHIKSAIAQWLRVLKIPIPEELKLLTELNTETDKFHPLFKVAVLAPEGWFDLLAKNGWLLEKLTRGSEEQAHDLLRLLNVNPEASQEAVNSVLRSALAVKPEIAYKLFPWFDRLHLRAPAPVLLNLYMDLIDQYSQDFLKNILNKNLSMRFYGWVESSPDLCGQLIKKIYSVWCSHNTDKIPFAREAESIIDSYSLSEIAKKSSLTFIAGTTDVFIYAVTTVLNNDGLKHKHGYNFSRRAYSGMNHGFDDFLSKYRESMIQLANEQPDVAKEYLLRLPAKKHECFMHIYLETIAAAPESLSYLLYDLVDDELVFDAGFDGAKWLSLANAYKSARPYLNDTQSKDIESHFTSYTPEILDSFCIYQSVKKSGMELWTNKTAIYCLNQSGYKQWCILETIGRDKLNDSSRLKLDLLRRKFPDCKIEKPDHIEASFVGSPLSKSATEKMDDQSWLSAITKYNHEWRLERSFDKGGARELARCLHGYSAQNPERFAALCLKIPLDSNPAYVGEIIRGLSESEDSSITDPELINVILYAHSHPEKPFGEAIAMLLRSKPHLAKDAEILDILIWYATYGTSSDDEEIDESNTARESTDISSLLQGGDRLYMRGINGVRGSAWDALNVVLSKVSSAEVKTIETIRLAVINEPLISVRCCIIESFPTIFNKDKKLFSELTCQLIDPANCKTSHPHLALSPLITRTGIHLFPYIFFHMPELAKELVDKLVSSGNDDMHLIGVWLIYCESFRNENYIETADTYSMEHSEYRKIMASVTRDVIGWTGGKNRAESLLNNFFHDIDDNIRNTASSAFRNIDKANFINYKNLCHSFIDSPAFESHSSSMLFEIEDVDGDVSDIIVSSAEKLINITIAKKLAGEAFGSDLYHLQDQIKSAYLASEANPMDRKKILDLIDLMLIHEIYGVEGIINIDDRY